MVHTQNAIGENVYYMAGNKLPCFEAVRYRNTWFRFSLFVVPWNVTWGNLDFWTFYFLPVGRPSTQWIEGPACLLCDDNGDQLVLHHVHWCSGWVSLFHFALHACPQPQLKISCSLRQPDAHTYSSLNQAVYHFHRSRVYFNMFFWSSLALWFYVGHSWHEVLEWSTTGRWK